MDLIPDELRRDHEDGEVVFVCGAGVSMPAGLPSFKGLVNDVLTDLLPSPENCDAGSTEALAWSAFDGFKYDEALNILENAGEDRHDPKLVRQRVHFHLTKSKTKTLDNHLTLTRLADLDTEVGRLVTTNFDHLFERAQSKLRRLEGSTHRLVVHVAPSIPPAKPETSRGLTYLHGKLGNSEGDMGLVLTMADFGTAYLLEGWARRFVIELFRHYHVVFIGYRVEDPTMRYLVSALASAPVVFKDAYVLAPYGGNEDNSNTKEDGEREWKLKGLIPLLYESGGDHIQLWQALKEWADDHRQGVLDHRQKVAQLGQFPPVDEHDPAIAQLVWALRDPDVARYFATLPADERPHHGWISHLQNAGLLSLPIGKGEDGKNINAPLVSRTLPDQLSLNEITMQFSRWISNSIEKQETLDWVLGQGAVLHGNLRWEIQRQLANPDLNLPVALRKIWQVLASVNYSHALSERWFRELLRDLPTEPNSAFTRQTLLNRLRPIPVFKVKPDYYRDGSTPAPERPTDWCEIDIDLVGIESEYDIEQFRKQSESWEETLANMAESITTRLTEALDWMHEFGLAFPDEDPTYMEYRSISPHPQNAHAPIWTQLIELARDSYDALVAAGDTAAATRLVLRWQSLEYPIFRRLTLYAAMGGRDA